MMHLSSIKNYLTSCTGILQ